MKLISFNPLSNHLLARLMKTTIFSVIIIMCILISGIGALPVRAASVAWDGGGGDNNWSTLENWVGDTLPQTTDYISISGSAGEVVLDVDLTLVGKLTVTGDGNTLRIDSGVTLTLDPSLPPGQLDSVIVDNGGTLVNDGTIEGAVLSPLPRIFVTSTSVYTGDSTLINNSTLHQVDVFLRGGPDNPTLNNGGAMNTVRISTLVGTVMNGGTINDAQLSFQLGTVSNEAGGEITTTSTLSSMGSRFINNTMVDNYGTFTNESTIDNEGIFNNYGTFDNTAGNFINSADLGRGTVGIFNNYGTFSGNPISTIGSLWDDDAGSGLWSEPDNWSGDVLPASTNDIVINIIDGIDTTVTVDEDITINGNLSIRNSTGSPTVVTLLIQSGATLTNNGNISFGSDTVIENYGSIINNSDIRASGTASFMNAGLYTGNPVVGVNSTWDGGGSDNNWSTPENWVGDTLPQTGNYIYISESAGEAVLDTDFTLVGKLTITGDGNTLRIGSDATLTLDPDLPPGQLDSVIVDNGGTLINDGTIEGTVLSPLPRIFVTSTTVYTGDSTFINNGTAHQVDVLVRGGPDNPTLNNDGTMNTVRISTLVGTVINGGTINDAQLGFQFGAITNEAGGAITTTSTLSSMGSRFINNTVFDNQGIFTNETTIDNEGIFNNYGTLDTTAGTFDNQGTFNAYFGSTLLGTISGNPVNMIAHNTAPVIDAGADQTVNEGDTVYLDPATFTDDDVADVHTATIDWGDDSPFGTGVVSESGGSGTVSGTHVYTDNGVYTVIVRVSDSKEESSDTFTLVVNNVAPIVEAGVDQSIDEGNIVVFSGSFFDPGASDTHDVSWDFGEGNADTSGTLSPSHTYVDEGIYEVTLTVTDNDGGTDSDSITITVDNLPPTVDAGPDQIIDLGDTLSIIADYTDAGIEDTHAATIDWGDGSPVEAGTVSESSGSGTVTGSHVYDWPGAYEVTVEVADEYTSASDTLEVEVLPVSENMVDTLSEVIDEVVSGGGLQGSLHAPLDTAISKITDSNPNNDVAAINALEAFINKVEAQRGKKIPDEVANDLIARARETIAVLRGG